MYVQDEGRTTRRGKAKLKAIYLFLFSDLVLLAKKKRFVVEIRWMLTELSPFVLTDTAVNNFVLL